MCTAVRNVLERTGSGTRVRINARTTGAVQSRFRYDLLASLLHLRQSGLDRVCTFRLLLSSLVCPLWLLCSPHARIAAAVHTCTIRVRCVEAGPRMLLCCPMLYPRMRSPCLLGYFPSNLHILLYRYPSCTPIWYLSQRQSYCGCCCTIGVREIELIVH